MRVGPGARQSASGPAYGIEAERTAIRDAAAANRWRLVWSPADDGATGAHIRRAGLTWALDQLAAGHADGLVVAKLNRLPSGSARSSASARRKPSQRRRSPERPSSSICP
ncbi:recombinase family protein [Micromonospora sp. CPCC 206060]|uniref:recombinase family protein n=1 Tax=Micromonospora sp. CPCC 206060 TaxID=3122406 RepID=UPI003FA54AFE